MKISNHKKKWRIQVFLFLGIALISCSLQAEIKLPAILGNNMVIQMDQPLLRSL